MKEGKKKNNIKNIVEYLLRFGWRSKQKQQHYACARWIYQIEICCLFLLYDASP